MLNSPERQVDSFPDILLRLWNFMLPKLLHCSGHDDERAVCNQKCLRLSADIVPDPKLSGCAQRQ